MNKRTGEKVGAAIGLIGSIVVGVLMIWQQTKPMRTEATFQKLKNELPKKIDDRTTAVDVDFDRRLVGDSEFVNVTYSYVIDFSVDNTPFDLHEIEQNAQQQLCANPDASLAIKKGNSISYHYASKEGVSLGDFTIATCDLPLRAAASDALNEALVASANKLNEHAPRMIDEVTRLDKATVSGHEFTYHYTLVQPPVKSPAAIQSTLAKMLCADVAWREGLAGGASVHAIYTRPDGKNVFDLTVTSADCN
jgi:hypothetical protein